MRLISRLMLALLFAAPLAQAVIETYEFSSRELEERYQQLSFELRCPKCQNQNIADSTAPIAQDLRKLLHQQLEAGATDDEVTQFMVSRYGEFVLYRPRFAGATVLLWLAPALLFLCAGAGLFFLLRRREQPLAGEPGVSKVELNEADQQRLRGLLDNKESGS